MAREVRKAGELVRRIAKAAEEHGLSRSSDVFVREGPAGKLRRINFVLEHSDRWGRHLILELHPKVVKE